MSLIPLLVNRDFAGKYPTTTDIDNIYFNFDTIEKHCGVNLMDKFHDNGMLFEIIPVFNFICIVVMTDKENGDMYFFDGSMDEEAAYERFKSFNQFKDSTVGNLFMKTYMYIQENYDDLSGKAELIYDPEE